MSDSISLGLASARLKDVGKRLKRAGVTMFTLTSVHCAESIVAIKSCKGDL